MLQLLYIRGLYKMIPLFARNVIFEKYRCTRHTLEDFAKKTSKSMLKLVCFFYFQVVAVWIFSHGFKQNSGWWTNLHMIICQKVVLHYNSFLNILYTVFNEYCIDQESFLIEVILCSFKETSHVCWHFLGNIAPMKESRKVC